MKVFGIGTFGKDPEAKTLQSGTTLCTFSLASTRKFKDANGERVTDWINCVSWGKTAEAIARFFHKGSKIMIEGELQTRNYEGKDGKKVYVTEINVSEFEFTDSKTDREPDNKPNSYQSAMQADDPEVPIDIADDDAALPFDL